MSQAGTNATAQARQKTEVKIPCLVYSRIVGYLTPVQNWNTGKGQEFTERKMFRVPDNVKENHS